MSGMPTRDPASLRDPNGRVYRMDNRIFRTVAPAGAQAFEAVWRAGILQKMAERGHMIGARLLEASDPLHAGIDNTAAYVLEHPVLPLITYPYEWPFGALKQAALAHLDLHLALLEEGFTLSDASAFNMQFIRGRALHMDVLSVTPYRDGEPWIGYRQFCREFLYPLMLEAATGLPAAPYLRATLEGITAGELLRLMPWHARIKPGFALHAALPAMAERREWKKRDNNTRNIPKLSRKRLRGLLLHLRLLVENERLKAVKTQWNEYAPSGIYTAEGLRAKQDAVKAFAHAHLPALLLDVGCHQGDYALCALEAGAASVVGVDSDRAAVEKAWGRVQGTEFMPLFMDMANPSPSHGWRGRERSAFAARVRPDAVTALAIMHHLVIGRSLPLAEVMDYIISLAPRGLIEFVPKSDPMVARMLRFRTDIFPDYTLEAARALLRARAEVVREVPLPGSGRVLFEFRLPDAP